MSGRHDRCSLPGAMDSDAPHTSHPGSLFHFPAAYGEAAESEQHRTLCSSSLGAQYGETELTNFSFPGATIWHLIVGEGVGDGVGADVSDGCGPCPLHHTTIPLIVGLSTAPRFNTTSSTLPSTVTVTSRCVGVACPTSPTMSMSPSDVPETVTENSRDCAWLFQKSTNSSRTVYVPPGATVNAYTICVSVV